MASLLVLVPFLGLLILNLPFGRSFLRPAAHYGVGAVALLQALALLVVPTPFLDGGLTLLGLAFSGDDLSRVLLVLIGLVALVSLVVGRFTVASPDARFLFENLLLASLLGMNGAVLVQDLFTLWVFIEIVGVTSFLLASHLLTEEGLDGALKYLVLSCVASAAMLAAIGLLFLGAGGTGFAEVKASLGGGGFFPTGLAMALFTVGLLIKGGLVPFHGWLPDTYTGAPPAVSVLFAGIVTKAGGIYVLLRLVAQVFGVQGPAQWSLLAIGALTTVVGALAAMGQRDMKRMLAWSSVSQVGYIVLGLGAGNPLGFAGAVFHLFNHTIFKTQLFVNAAAVEASTGTRDMDRMGGLSSRMPWTGGTSVVAFLSAAGLPPLSGFWSKLAIILALTQGGNVAYAVVAVAASLLTLAYFLTLQHKVFFGPIREGLEAVKEAHWGLVAPAVLLAAITIGAGLGFFYLLDTFIFPASSVLG